MNRCAKSYFYFTNARLSFEGRVALTYTALVM